MGVTLSKVGKQVLSPEGKVEFKLERNYLTDVIVEEILTFMCVYSTKYPDESKYVFERPLIWTTKLDREDFWYGFIHKDNKIISSRRDDSENPLVTLYLDKKGSNKLFVNTIDELENILCISADRKYDEIYACLEANPDPIANMVGSDFSILSNPKRKTWVETPANEIDLPLRERLARQWNEFDHYLDNIILKINSNEGDGQDPSGSYTENTIEEKSEHRTIATTELLDQSNQNNSYRESDVINYETTVDDINNSMQLRSYENITAVIRKRYERRSYTDLITNMRAHNVYYGKTRKNKAGQDSDTSDSEAEEASVVLDDANYDMAPEYWQISKLVKYIRGGIPTSTIISLCALRDMDLTSELCQVALKETGGIKLLINLLETQEVRCKIGALKILLTVSDSADIRRVIADMRGVTSLVSLLDDPNWLIRCLAAENICSVSRLSRARRSVRKDDGIRKLIPLLDIQNENDIDVECARCGALALWSCSKSDKNKLVMKKYGIIILLTRLLKCRKVHLLVPLVGILEECVSIWDFRVAIRTEGIINDLVSHLRKDNDSLQMHCSNCIFKCADEEMETREIVRIQGGIAPLVNIMTNKTSNLDLLAAVTGTIWKCCIRCPENVIEFQKLNATEKLCNLVKKHSPEVTDKYLNVESISPDIQILTRTENVLINVVGAISEMAKTPSNVAIIRKSGALPPLLNLLTIKNNELLTNVTKAVGECSHDQESMSTIAKLEGMRLIWSLLKHPKDEVQAAAAWALCPCVENAPNAAEMVRSFVGGLELMVGLLHTTNIEVRASVCSLIARVARDKENLAVITDHGVIPLLARLAHTRRERLRRYLAEAIATCCELEQNRVIFGETGAVAPLIEYLRSPSSNVHRTTVQALEQLSRYPPNCVIMRQSGYVPTLISLVSSTDKVLQEAAASCVNNIRNLSIVIADEYDRRKHKKKQ